MAAGRPVKDSRQKTENKKLLSNLRNTDERLKQETLLRKQAEYNYYSLAEHSPVSVYIVKNGRFYFANSRFRERTGFGSRELLKMKSIELIHPDDRGTARQNAIDMLKGRRTVPYEFRVVRKDGGTRLPDGCHG